MKIKILNLLILKKQVNEDGGNFQYSIAIYFSMRRTEMHCMNTMKQENVDIIPAEESKI